MGFRDSLRSRPSFALPPTQFTLRCDSSLQGWGSVIEGSDNPTGGRWSPFEATYHINYLELKAIQMGLMSLCNDLYEVHIKVLSDNQTAVAYIRNMGGTHSPSCNLITREILLWCKQRKITITISHLPGHLNVQADKASREFKDDIEWSLDTGVFTMLSRKWGQPQIDMFASRLNHKISLYVSWKPDPMFDRKSPTENSNESNLSNNRGSKVGDTILVPIVVENVGTASNSDTCTSVHFDIGPRSIESTSIIPQIETTWVSCVRKMLQEQGINGQSLEIILDSWRKGTKKQYSTYITQWASYCRQNKVSLTKPSLPQVLGFLAAQSARLGYSAVASTRSALSSFIKLDGVNLGEHPLVSRFMTGLFNRKPALPRYVETWNPQIVLDNIRSLPDNSLLSLKQLTMKLTVLMALVTAQRTQTLKALSLDGIVCSEDQYSFTVLDVLKQTSRHGGQNRHLAPVVFKKFPNDTKLCPFN
ncbi:uncharacterized protein LOC116296056 [Actinia tenebrosa]|uniref:Uncharacterized protein LOC116296056 n=1 Tax=Actinia tenebrosa TaxID=6105 RepID=A0A6P8I532_ACTTE|nr:uncharacterized protein LOC116296056 [Actinia tenebrosa]